MNSCSPPKMKSSTRVATALMAVVREGATPFLLPLLIGGVIFTGVSCEREKIR